MYVIERFGKYTRTLESGLSIIIPFVDRVAHKTDILERQLPKFQISVITKDNVEVGLVSKIKAEADAEQTRVVGKAIKDDGQPAVNFEIMKRQVEGLTTLASSGQSKTLVIPSDVTKALGSLELLLGTITDNSKD